MNIHILPSVGSGALLQSITETINSSGHQVAKLEDSEYVIGLTNDRDWQKVPDSERRIILKEPGKVDTVPASAVLVNVLLLTMIDDPTVTLADWLRTAPAPVVI